MEFKLIYLELSYGAAIYIIDKKENRNTGVSLDVIQPWQEQIGRSLAFSETTKSKKFEGDIPDVVFAAVLKIKFTKATHTMKIQVKNGLHVHVTDIKYEE